jgi:hypothetical protein
MAARINFHINAIEHFKRKAKIWLTVIMLYLSLSGLITFALFIHEEAVQTVMFGTWPAKNAKQWHIVLEGCDMMARINQSAKIINYAVGWIQPFAFFSYRAYSKATDFYIKGSQSEIFAHAPELFVGRKVDYTFYPKQIKNLDNGKYLLTNGKLAILYNNMPTLEKQAFTGILEVKGKYLVVVNDN